MLDTATPYYQAGLGNRLCHEITFNNYNRVTKSGVSSLKVPDAKYKITDISLEYEIVTQPDLVRSGLNTGVWPCCIIEFLDIERL